MVRPSAGVLVECHLHAMARQVLAQLDARVRLAQMLLVDDGDDVNVFCRLQHW